MLFTDKGTAADRPWFGAMAASWSLSPEHLSFVFASRERM
jgi:hypothetical protein